MLSLNRLTLPDETPESGDDAPLLLRQGDSRGSTTIGEEILNDFALGFPTLPEEALRSSGIGCDWTAGAGDGGLLFEVAVAGLS